jgi:hypothetical protein
VLIFTTNALLYHLILSWLYTQHILLSSNLLTLWSTVRVYTVRVRVHTIRVPTVIIVLFRRGTTAWDLWEHRCEQGRRAEWERGQRRPWEVGAERRVERIVRLMYITVDCKFQQQMNKLQEFLVSFPSPPYFLFLIFIYIFYFFIF